MTPETTVTRRLFVGGLLALPAASARGDTQPVPDEIAAILASDASPDAALSALMPVLVRALGTDRAFVYMRDPVARRVAFTHGFSAIPGWRSFDGGAWRPEPNPATLAEPMLKKAFSDPAALFVEDIETAAPGVLNADLERRVFGHRALVHAPLYHEGAFYGILETAVRDRPRVWTADDRALITWLQPRTARLAAAYLGHA